jgi:hypothetical protein
MIFKSIAAYIIGIFSVCSGDLVSNFPEADSELIAACFSPSGEDNVEGVIQALQKVLSKFELQTSLFIMVLFIWAMGFVLDILDRERMSMRNMSKVVKRFSWHLF